MLLLGRLQSRYTLNKGCFFFFVQRPLKCAFNAQLNQPSQGA